LYPYQFFYGKYVIMPGWVRPARTAECNGSDKASVSYDKESKSMEWIKASRVFAIFAVLSLFGLSSVTDTAGFAMNDPTTRPVAKDQNPAAAVVNGPLGENADRILREEEAAGFSGVVLIAKDGTIILLRGYGLANRASKTPMAPETVVQIGSCTKDFTTVAILQLYERKRLDLNDSISKSFDGVPKDKQPVTINQLLGHRAGFDTYLGGDFDAVSREEMLKNALATKLLFAPGTSQSYSNPGFSLLAAVVEKISDETFDEYVRDNILKPLGLRDTGFLLPRFDPGRIAHGYRGADDLGIMLEKPHAADGPYWNLRGNGGMLSTVTDMFHFYRALGGEALLKPATRDLRFPAGDSMMLAGSDGAHFFLYNHEPGAGFDILLASNAAEFRAPAVREKLAVALGIPAPGQRGRGEVVVEKAERSAASPAAKSGAPEKAQRRVSPDNFLGSPATFTLPDTPAGRAAATWLRVLNQSNRDMIRRYIREATAPAPANDRQLEARIESYRAIHERLGFLRPVSVEVPSPYELAATFNSAQKTPLTLIFTVEPAAPNRLLSVK
jgi:CubicO group peptidase (beta-lactamase class C family)